MKIKSTEILEFCYWGIKHSSSKVASDAAESLLSWLVVRLQDEEHELTGNPLGCFRVLQEDMFIETKPD